MKEFTLRVSDTWRLLQGGILDRRRFAILIVWCALMNFAFSGCIITPGGSDAVRSNLNEETASKIIPGKTTRDDVLMMLGKPNELLENGKQFTYTRKYELALAFPGGLESGKQLNRANRYLLIIDFDERGIVSRRDFIAPYEFHDKPLRGGVPPFSLPPSYR